MMGPVYPERVHGFALNIRESFKNFKTCDVKVGMGTDGGTGVTFCGDMSIEFDTYKHFGYTEAEILRSATLTNMEILELDETLGSIDVGKFADMVLLDANPLEDIMAVKSIKKVFKDGRCYVDNTN